MRTGHVLDALEQPLQARPPVRHVLFNHSHVGSKHVSITYSECPAKAGVEPSVGSKDNSCDNAVAQILNGLQG